MVGPGIDNRVAGQPVAAAYEMQRKYRSFDLLSIRKRGVCGTTEFAIPDLVSSHACPILKGESCGRLWHTSDDWALFPEFPCFSDRLFHFRGICHYATLIMSNSDPRARRNSFEELAKISNRRFHNFYDTSYSRDDGSSIDVFWNVSDYQGE
jgi:hypothetical protein